MNSAAIKLWVPALITRDKEIAESNDVRVWCRPFDAMISGRILKEAESMNELMRKVDGVCD
jgi:hypothetical protein